MSSSAKKGDIGVSPDLTWVPSFRLLRSNVTPEGTATLERTIVAQDFCEALAEAAPLEPEKVQLARFSRLGAAVMAGSATGVATAQAARAAIAR